MGNHQSYYTIDEIKKHKGPDSYWIIANGKVYDISQIIDVHPGGRDALIKRSGGKIDASEDYYFHSRKAQKIWNQLEIGRVKKY